MVDLLAPSTALDVAVEEAGGGGAKDGMFEPAVAALGAGAALEAEPAVEKSPSESRSTELAGDTCRPALTKAREASKRRLGAAIFFTAPSLDNPAAE